MNNYEFNVEMTCEGCSSALERLLARQKSKGSVTEYTVDLATQVVTVKTSSSFEETKAMLEKSGKKVSRKS